MPKLPLLSGMEVVKGTLRAIIRQSGLSREGFLELLE